MLLQIKPSNTATPKNLPEGTNNKYYDKLIVIQQNKAS